MKDTDYQKITQLNREIEFLILKSSKIEIPDLDGFTGKSYQTFKEELIATPKISFRGEKNKSLPTHFISAASLLIQRQNKAL